MKVRAKWSVKDATGWHDAGEVFETEADLGNAVEVLEEAKKPKAAKKAEPEPKPEETAEAEPAREETPVQEPVKPRSTARRKVGNTTK